MSPAPSNVSQDDGGFTSNWVNQQEHQLGPMQSTDQTRREIQEMPSTRPPVEEDDEESECCYLFSASSAPSSVKFQCLYEPYCLNMTISLIDLIYWSIDSIKMEYSQLFKDIVSL